ncbi:DNA polymerase III subunit gamma/tau [Moraxella catarrhalis]|uniref:DNA polymerase III subunit gamma/tau n=1 Tax=Moraxella catarrhalis TaxID=480 RepID=UPI0008033D7D|nr:DNA polymerase III subunit gamma/tau [Moraxella catarrhalis]MPW54807.1 DNA polymerase III subunit gamma/tau [Moraxella catarrhalis]OBX40966.1 DNA polymerase III, subunit gamma and tau [Moraxella catarrhalis]RKL95088.1 DNA polymerase III subunit gamma/tau [Moraxella catarrhalis]RKL99335.1 DNA polymerase III subunit gamma/tau [Moraxella catarrhalis]
MDKQYQVLARKYRPKNFSELLGQSHVAQALSNAIDTGRLHHAYLFTGTRGVGKTTIARILAKCLNCETGMTSQPCGVCDTCISIDQGRFLDLIEIDAASRTKVEDTRELLENVPYPPVQGRYKVYLIDEVHMLSTHSFNALLKTLEEPPDYVKFVFATTDPQKLPITIISRCLQFVLRPLPQACLFDHLAKVLDAEKIPFTENALWQLASTAKGSVRDALSLTDQAIAFGGGQIQTDTVLSMLGLVNRTDVLEIIETIYHDDRMAISQLITNMRDKMVDATAIFDELIDCIHQMALMQVLPDIPLDMNDEQAHQIKRLSSAISSDILQLYYEILIKSRDGIRLASTPMQALEMGILRLLAFRPLAEGQVTVLNDTPAKQPEDADNHNNMPDDIVDGLKDQACAAGEINALSTDSHFDSDKQDDLNDLASQIGTELILDQLDNDNVNTKDGQDTNQFAHTDQAQSTNIAVNLTVSEENFWVKQPQSDPPELLQTDEDSPSDHDTLTQMATEPSLAVMSDSSDTDELTADFTEDLQSVPAVTVAALAKVDSNKKAPHQADLTAHQPASHNLDQQPISHFDHINPSKPLAHLPSQPMTKAQMLEQLKPTPIELEGGWTSEKWDYWVHLAREEGHFAPDELALMSTSVMAGDIAGESRLLVAEINSQVQSSFENLHAKFLEHYPQIKLSLEPVLVDCALEVPKSRLSDRHRQVQMQAQHQLVDSPVFQTLWQGGFIIDDGTSVLNQSKLLID